MALFERILEIILPVFIIVAIGYIYMRARGEQGWSDLSVVNRVTMDVLSPLLIFTALASKDFDIVSNGPLVLAGVLISLGSGLLAWPVARLLGYDARSFVPPMMFSNGGNMGLPLAILAFGAAALPAAVALFLACLLIYLSVGIKIMETGRHDIHTSFFKLMLSPNMIAMFLGIAVSVTRLSLPAPLFNAMKMLGDTCIPIMLFGLGMRMIDVSFKSWQIGLAGGIICPVSGLIVAWMLDGLLPLDATQRGQMYLFASLPPGILCYMVAEQYNQEPEKVASIVLLGHICALVFVPIGLWIGLKPG
jgi:malate permease and related proteins